jgi:hypothetical protein
MLYHYTRVENLKKILEAQKLLLTNISCFEDVSEFLYTVSILSRELSLSSEDEINIKSALTENINLIFVGCFCSDSNSPYLWEKYGDCNIEFSEEGLVAMVQSQQRSTGNVTTYSNPLRCEYCKVTQVEIIKSALKQWKQMGDRISVGSFSHLATIFKRSNYCPEQETRLVVHLKDSSLVKKRERDAVTVRYWELPFRSHDGPLPIKSITIGPVKYPEETARNLRVILSANNLENIAINHSSIL